MRASVFLRFQTFRAIRTRTNTDEHGLDLKIRVLKQGRL